jgi:hypothetical protein
MSHSLMRNFVRKSSVLFGDTDRVDEAPAVVVVGEEDPRWTPEDMVWREHVLGKRYHAVSLLDDKAKSKKRTDEGMEDRLIKQCHR